MISLIFLLLAAVVGQQRRRTEWQRVAGPHSRASQGSKNTKTRLSHRNHREMAQGRLGGLAKSEESSMAKGGGWSALPCIVISIGLMRSQKGEDATGSANPCTSRASQQITGRDAGRGGK
jgi:hypothetical protein